MIDGSFVFLNLTLVCIGLIMIARFLKGKGGLDIGLAFIFLSTLMSGIELAAHSDNPWEFIFYSTSFEEFFNIFLEAVVYAGFVFLFILFLTTQLIKITKPNSLDSED
ncbi:MAG: hypothetical protein IBX55_00430 [Methyloprofundus sp.]|nr:hypothetical protein [Methyloprofundus sp.]